MTLPASEETVVRTISGETFMGMPVKAYMVETPYNGKFATHWSTHGEYEDPIRLYAESDVIARIRSEREQAVRECAEIAGTQRGETADGQYTWWEVSNNIRNRILSLSQVSAKK